MAGGQWAGNMGKGECCSSIELHERRGSQRGLKYLRRTLVGETPWSGGQGLIGSQV